MRHPATLAPFDTNGGSTAPGAAQNLSATAGADSAGVSWTPPSDGGSSVTGYTVTCSPNCAGATGLTAGPSDTGTTVGGLTAGTQYTFTVYATNSVGGGEPGTTNSVTVKSPKPNAPTLALDPGSDTGASNSDGITSDDKPTFKGTADPGVTVSVFSDGGSTAICTDQADGSGSWTCAPSTSLADGTHTITATGNNGYGDSDPSNALSVTIATEAPKVAIDSASEPSEQTNATSAAFTFTAQDQTDALSTYICTLDGTASPCSSSTAAPAHTNLADGSHTFTVQATDLAGNTDSATYTWLVDTQAPATVASGSLTDTGASYAFAPSTGLGPWTNDASGVTVNLSAGDANGSLPVSGVKSVDYSIGGAQTTTNTSVSGSSATVKITAEGASTITYFAVDNAGNAGTPQTVTVDIDRTAPALHSSVSPNPVVLNGQTSATPGAIDTGSGVSSQSCGTPSTAKVGSMSVSCTATDIAGNTATAKAAYDVTYGVHTLLDTSVFGLEAVTLQLQDANGANASSRGTRVAALCVVPHTAPATTSCGSNKALNADFTYLPLMRGLYAYVLNTKGLIVGQQYDLLFRATGDPVVHAVTFTEKRQGLLGSLSVPATRTDSSVRASTPKLRTGIWVVPSSVDRHATR